jgi:hypothetical protein
MARDRSTLHPRKREAEIQDAKQKKKYARNEQKDPKGMIWGLYVFYGAACFKRAARPTHTTDLFGIVLVSSFNGEAVIVRPWHC